MKKVLAVLLCVLWVGTACAFQPRTGNWWNPAESGRDFNIEIQNGVLVLVVYAYQASGPAQWYLASGPMTNSGHTFSGTLDKYMNGQCLSCAYRPPLQAGNDGTITINFASETAATVTLPGGFTTNIQPFNFSGNPPQGLLGEWIFVYDIISGGTTFAERFNFTTTTTGTSTGSGLVVDPIRFAACEHQISGQFVGYVVCFDWTNSSLSTIENQYIFRFGIDEGYGGSWISPISFNQYSMKALKVVSQSGVSRILSASKAGLSDASSLSASAEGPFRCVQMTPIADPELTQIAEGMRQTLCALN